MCRAVVICMLVACGRVGFSSRTGDDAPAMREPIAYIGSVIGRDYSGATDTFPVQAHAAGNVIVIDVACISTPAPSAVSLAAPGWSIVQLDPITASPNGDYFAASFGALAPDTKATTFTLAWVGATCASASSELGDELANTDPSGATTFDAHVQTTGNGTCTATVVTGHAGDAIWAACYSRASVSGTGAGYTKASDDADGDWSEYLITTDPAGTSETATFVNPGNEYILAAVALH